ncbi:ABC transporter permease [Paraliobacillus sp. JSM ZJ581]|uniref:ABC transporter permease n=1 Tax=Paraliobacillus sp. JSM ZJ581 TaxID=3342118 RepID=UPI0035A84888
MINLIKLEQSKFDFNVYYKWIIIVNVILTFFVFLIPFVERSDNGVVAFSTYLEAFNTVNILVGAAFTIFASVLISKLIIEEYKNKTILILFSYPIKRKKILTAKIIVVISWTFITLIISSLFVSFAFLIMDSFLKFVPEQLSMSNIIQQVVKMITNSLAISGISLIPLYFGMLKKSVPATILSSILIVAFLGFNTESFSLASIIIVPVILAIIGIMIAYMAIRKVETEDLT